MQWVFKYRYTFDHEIDGGFAIFLYSEDFYYFLGMWSELTVWTSRFSMIVILILTENTWKYFVLLETSLNHMMNGYYRNLAHMEYIKHRKISTYSVPTASLT